MTDPLGRQLYEASKGGRVSEVSSLLKDNPGLNVNWTDSDGWTPLHDASFHRHVEVIKLLFAHPDININVKNKDGATPFSLACERGRVSVVRLMLKDPRVDVTLSDNNKCTPLWWASCKGGLEVVKWLIASNRDLGDISANAIDWSDGEEYSALEIARQEGKTEVMSLLELFTNNPAQTRHEVRVKLGVLDELAADVYAMTVFLCDELLQLKSASNPDDAHATRFFTIVKRLPMELQMVLCHRAVGSMRQNILHKDSEAAFKSLASILLLLSQSE